MSPTMRDISNQDQLDAWLSKNGRVAPALVLRAVLRILPLIYHSQSLSLDLHLKLVLQTFRAVFTVWAAQEYSLSIKKVVSACAIAIDTAREESQSGKEDPSIVDATAFAAARVAETYSRSRRKSYGVDGARYAVDHVVSAEQAGAAFWKAVTDDVNWVDARASLPPVGLASDLISRPLWIDDVRGDKTFRVNFPIWARRPWDLLKKMPAAQEAGFGMWFRWYESILSARKQGRFDKTLKGEAERQIVLRIAAQTDEFWHQSPPTLNAEIRAWIEEAKGGQFGSPPQVPENRPAAIEPLWLDGKLTLPAASLPSDLDEGALLAALGALREDLAELAADVVRTENIDHRPAEYLRRLADRIPDTMPSQALLFRLGHANEVLNDLTHTTDLEWPDLLAARYRRLALQYERAVRQFPKWRAFVRNAAEQELTTDQVAEIPLIVETVVAELQTDDAKEFVDPAIPNALQATQAPIVDWERTLKAGNEQLAEDLLESINNVLKRTVELSLALKSAGMDPVANWLEATAKKSAAEFGKEAAKSIVKEFGSLGKATGPALGRFLKRVAKVTVYGGAAGGGGILLLHRLITFYPDTFRWLEPALRFLHLL